MKWLETDIVVAGGGIAGALTTFLLYEQGLPVTWVVPGTRLTSTKAGAGVMNPVTGRNFTLSWKFRELLEEALSTYRLLEERSKSTLLHRAILWRSLPTPSEENGWCIRLGDPLYSEYMSEPVPPSDHPFLKGARSLGVIDPVWRVDMPGVVEAVRTMVPSVIEGFVTSDRKLVAQDVILDIPSTTALVWATGADREIAKAFALPLRPFKGEAMIISSPDLPEDRIIYHDLKVVPLGGARFWVGPSDPKQAVDIGPTYAARMDLVQRFEKAFDVSYEVQTQEAGIRPASVRRRPFAGQIPGLAHTWLINGLGTKGASLAPWAARHLVTAITGKGPVEPELNWPWKDLS